MSTIIGGVSAPPVNVPTVQAEAKPDHQVLKPAGHHGEAEDTVRAEPVQTDPDKGNGVNVLA